MKARAGIVAAMAAGAYAQAPSSTSISTSTSSVVASPSVSAPVSVSSSVPPVLYTTITYDDCVSAFPETLITITNGVTVTFCPECVDKGSTSPFTPPSPPSSHGGGYTTVYTTTYKSLCPTGVVDATYTVTESCTDAAPTWTPGPDHIPDGFTVTEKECTVCAKTPTTVTITEPCGCHASNGVKVTPTPGSSSGGSSPAGGAAPGGNSPSGSSPTGGSSPNQGGSSPAGGSSGGSPAPGSSGGAASPAQPTTTTAQCPGPQCRAAATPGAKTNSTVPYKGSASSFSSAGPFTFAFTAILAFAGLAFAL